MDLDAIFADPTAEDAQDRVDAVIEARGWPAVRAFVLAILEDPDRPLAAWELAAAVVWGGCCDEAELPVDRTIALVYARLPADPGSSENNLAWSIAARLKRRSYLSSYDPRADPAVARELATIARRPPADD